MFSTLGIQFHIFRQIWLWLHKKNNETTVTAYELFTLIDSYRATIENKAVVYEVQILPYKQFDFTGGLLKEIAESGELIREDYTREMNFDEFVFLFPKHSDRKQELRKVFESLDFYRTQKIRFYNFLAIIDTYIEQVPPSPRKLAHNPLEIALQKIRDLIQHKSSLKSLNLIFGQFDSNHDGKITKYEFNSALRSFNIDLDNQQIDELHKIANTNDEDEEIDFDEFLAFIAPLRPRYLDYSVYRGDKPEITYIEVDYLEGYRIRDFQEDTLDHAKYRIKQYIKSNENSSGSIYRICERLDEDKDGFLTDLEFEVALENTKLGFSIKQLQGLYEHIVRDPTTHLIDYDKCIKGICAAEYG